jgi:tRNA 2-selenouridine synthase
MNRFIQLITFNLINSGILSPILRVQVLIFRPIELFIFSRKWRGTNFFQLLPNYLLKLKSHLNTQTLSPLNESTVYWGKIAAVIPSEIYPSPIDLKTLPVEDFLNHSGQFPILDVRSPSEFTHAHIPGAISFPLFIDEERKLVGTAYKQESREKAIKIGLDFFGPKMRHWIEWAEEIGKKNASNTFLIHCWRGGMRSQSMAWLLGLYGFEVYLLEGGYKAYRNWILKNFEKEWPLLVLGGYTGSGKTAILLVLKMKGETVIDLEALASHRGSSFGHLGLSHQPSVEMFENLLAMQLRNAEKSKAKFIWLEAESQRIGNVNMPNSFFEQVKKSPIAILEVPFEERLNSILSQYGQFEKEDLIQAVLRIQKRLGGLETKNCINLLLENQLREAFSILLRYYDRWYEKSMSQKPLGIFRLNATSADANQNADLILNWKKSWEIQNA